jgi:uncharacterized protein (TIGR03545 family)
MKDGIFKKGLVFIGVICILAALVWFLVVDRVVKMVIESEGSKAVGAKVDVGETDLSLFPASIEVLGLAVTDPDSPMENAVAVSRLYSDIELLPLIRRKVIINNLRMEGIQLKTPRKTSGEIPRFARSKTAEDDALPPWLAQMCEAKDALKFTFPKVEDILAAEQLQSTRFAKQLHNQIDEAKTQWQHRLKELPAQKEFDAYKARLDKLKSSEGGLTALLGSATELKSLQADLKNDLEAIKQAHKRFNAELKDLKIKSAQLTKAPLEEVQRLKAKYALSPKSAANFSRMLFGPKICDWWKKGYHWYARIKPYLDSETANKNKEGSPKAEDRQAGKEGDLPDFLIRRAHIDALLAVGNFTGEASDITSDPSILGKPLRFKFLGRQLKQVKSIHMNGIIDFIKPENPNHQVKLQAQQLGLQNLSLSDAGSLPLSIANALADITMDLNLIGPQIDALVNAQLDSVRMAVEKTDTSELNAALADALTSVTRFGLTAMVEGTRSDYLTNIESDLDDVLNKAVGAMIKNAGKKLESKLSKAIFEQTKGPIRDTQKQLGSLGRLDEKFAQRLKLGNNFLKNIKLPF